MKTAKDWSMLKSFDVASACPIPDNFDVIVVPSAA
jgi:hypothetical protein